MATKRKKAARSGNRRAPSASKAKKKPIAAGRDERGRFLPKPHPLARAKPKKGWKFAQGRTVVPPTWAERRYAEEFFAERARLVRASRKRKSIKPKTAKKRSLRPAAKKSIYELELEGEIETMQAAHDAKVAALAEEIERFGQSKADADKIIRDLQTAIRLEFGVKLTTADFAYIGAGKDIKERYERMKDIAAKRDFFHLLGPLYTFMKSSAGFF